MDIETLEEALEDLLPSGFSIETNKHGELVIFTNLKSDDDGELIPLEDEEIEVSDLDTDPLEDEEEDEDD